MSSIQDKLFPVKGSKDIVFRNNLALVKDRQSHSQFQIQKQGGNTVYLDVSGRRLGYIDHLGKTLSHTNKILADNPRPDLILLQTRTA